MLARRLFLSICFLLISGCATRPSMTYHKIDSQNNITAELKLTDSYFLNASRITIFPVSTKDDNGALAVQYNISSDPIEFQDFKVGVRSKNNLVSTTKLNITKAENSDRFASGGTETTDNLKTLVSTVGGVLVKSAGLIVSSSPTPAVVEPPLQQIEESCSATLQDSFILDLATFDGFEVDKEASIRFDKSKPETTCIKITVGALPPDARKMDEYPWGIVTSEYFYSACRNIKVTVSYPDRRKIIKNIRVADTKYYQTVQYPYKGTVSMHTQCGVSVKTDALSNPYTGLDAFAELLKQAEAIKNTNK